MKNQLSNILFMPLTALLLWACGPSGSSFRIKGSFKDMQGGEIYIYNLSGDRARFDTLTVREGEFIYRGEASETTPYMLTFPNGMEQVIFVGQGQDITYEATASDLKNYVVNGSDENKLMNKFRQETYTQNPSAVVSTARQYIQDNAQSLVAVYLFENYFVNNPEVSTQEISSLLKTLLAKQPDNRSLRDVEGKLALATMHDVGKTLPNVKVTKRDKSTRNLWDTQKDYNLITFWSTWHTSGYEIGWKLRQLNDDYKSEGKLRIAAISLDIELYRWQESTRMDSTTTIEHYCDALGFESPVAKKCGITKLPCFILTDKSHKILSTTNDFDKMKGEIKKYMN